MNTDNDYNNNNIDNQIFHNHDTYVYYSKPLLESEHITTLEPINKDLDTVTYSNFITHLYVNGEISGNYKVNRFQRDIFDVDLSTSTFIGTITTNKGTLIINYAGEIIKNNNLYLLGQKFTTYATYKSGEYLKYLNVKVSIDVSNNDYRVMTISY